MQITAIFASPRQHSASSHFAEYLLQKAGNADIRKFYLRKMKYEGCRACYACQTKLDRCIINDDLSPVYNLIYSSDILLLATPIFFDNVPSQLKAFMDRCQAFFIPNFLTAPVKSRLPPGKTLIMLTTQEQKGINRYHTVHESYLYYFKLFGFKNFHFLAQDQIGHEFNLKNHKEFFHQLDNLAELLFTAPPKL
jgi:multimeric flavodoxin WrbA